MAKAVICPVCEGSGKYYIPPPVGSTLLYGDYNIICHGCGGQGWIVVPEAEDGPFPFSPSATREAGGRLEREASIILR